MRDSPNYLLRNLFLFSRNSQFFIKGSNFSSSDILPLILPILGKGFFVDCVFGIRGCVLVERSGPGEYPKL